MNLKGNVLKWQNEMMAGKDAQGKKYSETYRKTMHNQLSCIFNHACRYYNMKENPARKAGNMGKEQTKEMQFWTTEEYKKFSEAIMDKEMSYYAFEMLYWTGIRLGECFALCMEDFDFTNDTVRINKSDQRLEGYEEKLYKDLGGNPTTIILRFTDDTVDCVAKTKYHKWLNNKVPDLKLPVSKQEEDADTQSDVKYEGAARYLRTYANSHREQFPRVYQELKKYNYWRNIYGCKWYALLLYGILAVREMLIADKFNIADVFLNPIPKYTILLVLFGCYS